MGKGAGEEVRCKGRGKEQQRRREWDEVRESGGEKEEGSRK